MALKEAAETQAIVLPEASARRRFPFIHFGISRKLGAIFFLILIVSVANVLVMSTTLRNLNGFAESVNVAGRLRMLSQKIAFETVSIQREQGRGKEGVPNLLREFDMALGVLDRGGSAFGYQLKAVSPQIAPLLQMTQRDWRDYRSHVEAALADAAHVTPALIAEDAGRLLADAETMVGALTVEIKHAQESALVKMYVLLLIDVAVLVLVFVAVRRQVVRPLHDLAEYGRALAQGCYATQLDIRSRDEIGQLATVFTQSARHIGELIERIERDKFNLQQAEAMFRGLAENSVVGVYIAQNGAFRFVNPKMAQMFAYASDEMIASVNVFDIVPEDERERVAANIRKRIEGEVDFINYERKARRKDGVLFDVEVFGSKMEIDGDIATIGVMLDITERKRVDRALRVLSACNRALVHAAEETALLGRVCEIVHDISGYPFVMVSYLDAADPPKIEAVAQAGGGQDVLAIAAQYMNGEAARVTSALLSGHTTILQDLQWDVAAAAWPRFMSERQIVAAVSLPLRTGDRLFGSLTIYSHEKNAFTPDEVRIVEELADNLSYGIAALRADAASMRYAKMLEHHANHDILTGLANRHRLSGFLRQSIAAARDAGLMVAVLLLDLDRFKVINDSLGHAVGDALLQAVALRLRSCVRATDTVARFGGDEFVLVIPGLAAAEDVVPIACKILDSLAQPFSIARQDTYIGASIGISLYPQDGDNEDVLLKNVDLAMYRAKQNGRTNYQFFTEEISASNRERHALEADLHHALSRGELLLHYQPKVDLLTREMIGVEALVRWNHPQHGMIAPSKFIPIAEDSGLIIPLGQWVLRSACAQGCAWQAAGIRPINISVNLSGRQFRHHDLPGLVRNAIAETGIAATLLELEITESAIMQDAQESVATLLELKKLGVRLSLDDFGTGYSSLNYLRRFPLDTLKIDRLFIEGIGTNSQDRTIVKAVIALAHNLNLNVIAEGVENKEQLAFLEVHRCNEIQGYYFSKPVPAERIPALLAARVFENVAMSGE